MKSKYAPRYLKVDFMDMSQHWAVGIRYPIKGCALQCKVQGAHHRCGSGRTWP